ncbi:MAG TPA: CsbD family protein [Solirubrobacteraceae bacterium]|nr:CsbD family protein [Solirubrobacteraceae bacterium]
MLFGSRLPADLPYTGKRASTRRRHRRCRDDLFEAPHFPNHHGAPMTNKHIDKAKGRAKEAAGALTGDRHLKNQGRVDQVKGSTKKAIAKVDNTLAGRKKK